VFSQHILVVLVALLFGAYAPLGYVQIKRRARLNHLLAQLSDAFELMARCIRAGHTMSQSLQAVADEFTAPVSHEFSLCFEQMNLGLSPEFAMRDLARRAGLLEIKIFVLALLIQTQTGGNLAELLEKLAAMIRDRSRIQGKIQSFTAEGRLQAGILLALPPLLFLVILVLNRTYAAVLLDHPSLLVGMFVCEALGALWIRRIINFDF
jgi:tight adherence protein B